MEALAILIEMLFNTYEQKIKNKSIAFNKKNIKID